MRRKIFSGKKFFTLPTDPEKSWNVTGNHNIFCPALFKQPNRESASDPMAKV